jgi:hypothetical protein
MWLVESLIVDFTPVSRWEESARLAISFRPFCSPDHDEHPHSLSPVATWTNMDIAQKKTWHKTRYDDFN